MTKPTVSNVTPGEFIDSYTHDILDKNLGINTYVGYMFDKTSRMFDWEGLPDTCPAMMLELYLQIYGSVIFTEVKEEDLVPANVEAKITFASEPGIYFFRPYLYGAPNIYYQRPRAIVAHPALVNSKDLVLDVDCVHMRNDGRMKGLIPLFTRYASQLVENDISIRAAQINSRAQHLVTADNSNDVVAAQKYTADLEAGRLSAYGSNAFLKGIDVKQANYMTNNAIIQLIELQQYLKASWYNEIGLNTSFNMKREYLSAEEIKASTDILLPLIDDMYVQRQIACEKLKKLYGLDVNVQKASAWENKQEESDQRIEGVEEEPDGEDEEGGDEGKKHRQKHTVIESTNEGGEGGDAM